MGQKCCKGGYLDILIALNLICAAPKGTLLTSAHICPFLAYVMQVKLAASKVTGGNFIFRPPAVPLFSSVSSILFLT